MSSEYLARNVKKENESQYDQWPLSADVRRYIYLNYAISPEDRAKGLKPRDIWAEAAERFDSVIGGRIVDIGASSGYFIEKLLERGHRGQSEIIGLDSAAEHFPVLETFLKRKFGHEALSLIEGDAQRLSSIPDKFAQAASGLFIAYHLPRPHNLFAETHRIVEQGGPVLFGARNVDNLTNAWRMAQMTAKAHNAVMPAQNFYTHFSLNHLIESVDRSKLFKLVEIIPQEQDIFIPSDQEGWLDVKAVVLSYLSLMQDMHSGQQLRHEDVDRYLESDIRDYFESLAAFCGGYFPDKLSQGIVVAQNQ